MRVLAIAPYSGMTEMLNQIKQSRDDIDLTIQQGNLHDGLDIARTLLRQNTYDVVISRGGTAELLKKELNNIVIEIPLSVYDILRCIKMAQNYGGKFAIAGFRGITSSAQVLCDLLQIDTKIETFQDESDVLPVLQNIREEGFSLVVCDQIGQITAQSIGLNSIFIPSGLESIHQAIAEAVHTVHANSVVYRQMEIFKSAIMADECSHMIFDTAGNVIFSSIKKMSIESRVKELYHTHFKNSDSEESLGIVRKIGGIPFEIRVKFFWIDNQKYSFLKIAEKRNLYGEEDRTIAVYNNIQDISQAESMAGNNSANLVGELYTLIGKYASTSYPIVITGESGTGKAKAADLIYAGSASHIHPYYVINCRLMTDAKWNSLMNDDSSPLGENNITINFKDMQELSDSQLSELYAFIKDTALLTRDRIIFSVLLPGERSDMIREKLMNQFSCLLLALKPLRERTEDIPGIATIYLNQLNDALGKQIIGFQAPAIQLLQQYTWPDNLNQFHRIMKELTSITDGYYISEADVKYILGQEKAHAAGSLPLPDAAAPVDLHQPLVQIEKDVLNYVLRQENMSREAAAKRLGISRTTLWRMLKNR